VIFEDIIDGKWQNRFRYRTREECLFFYDKFDSQLSVMLDNKAMPHISDIEFIENNPLAKSLSEALQQLYEIIFNKDIIYTVRSK